MTISATVMNRLGEHQATVRTGDKEQSLAIAAKSEGSGSGVNGGELLFLALATCYCNDLYREATAQGLSVEAVAVEVTGQFGGRGEPAHSIRYRASVTADASEEQIADLMRYTDTVGEIHNTLRQGTSVVLEECTVLPRTTF